VSSDLINGIHARVPFFVVLRDYAENARGADRVSLIEYLEAICNSPYGINPPAHAIEYLLLNDRALVVFDGLDELIDTSLRRDVVQAVEGFAYRYPTTPIVVTSRRIGYEEASLDSDLFPVAQLKEFSQEQVRTYAQRWFQLDEDQPATERQRLTAAFLRDSEFVSDLRVNPLMLSLMCGIYATENYIPRNRPEVYEKCALLLFERWDKQRGITVPLPFEAHVHAAMRSLALYMYSQEQPQLIRSDLVGYIKRYLLEKRFDDPDVAERAAEEFIDFCKGRAWVLTDVGHEKYGFTHRTFLEYFSASQLVRLNPRPEALFAVLRDHLCAREWDAVAQLALQILGRTVEDGADDFLKITIQAAASVDGHSRVNLLSFASRALQFIVPRPEVVRGIVASCIELLADPPNTRERRRTASFELRASTGPSLNLLGASNELRSSLARQIRSELQRSLEENWRKESLWALAFVPWFFYDLSPEDSIRADWTYWQHWAKENRRFLTETISLAQAKYYWLDLMRLGVGELDMKEVLDRHGAKALFEYRVAGYGTYPPIVYNLLGGYAGSVSVLRSLRPGRRVSTSRIIDDLETYLPEIPPPWLPYRRDYLVLTEILHTTESRRTSQTLKRMSQELIFFMAAPLVELEIRAALNIRNYPLTQIYSTPLKAIFNARRTGEAESAFPALEQLTTNAARRDIIRRWVMGEISYIKFPRQRTGTGPDQLRDE
jgi:hypothetical protein